MQRAQEARGLAQDGDDPRVGLNLGDALGGRVRPEIQTGGLADALLGRGSLEQREILIEVLRCPTGAFGPRRRRWVYLLGEEPRLLPGHVDLDRKSTRLN